MEIRSIHHNIQARKAADAILSNWRNGTWRSPKISRSVHLTRIDSSFPSPDECFFEPTTSTRIAMEFKPGDRETQRGLLTGVGQCVAYLNRHGASYLVAPNSVSDNHRIGDYLEIVFRKVIYDRLPVGLVTYGGSNLVSLQLRCDISNRLRLPTGNIRGLDVNYWAAWRDTPPHAIYLLLKTADEISDNMGRGEKIWHKYYLEQYVVGGSAVTIQDVPSNIKMWDGTTSQIPLQGIKRKLRGMVARGEITTTQALEEIRLDISPHVGDNNYRDIKKNHYNFVNHLMLWDEDFRPTKHGKELLEIGRKFGETSQELKDFLGYLLLDVGRHAELIKDVKNAISNSPTPPRSMRDVRSASYDYLESRGYIKRNPNRTSTGVRKFLSSEFGVWGHFGILTQHRGSYFIPGTGLSFDKPRIEELLALENTFS